MTISESLETLSQQLIPSDMSSLDLDIISLARFEFIQQYMGGETLIKDKTTFLKQFVAYQNEEVKDEISFVKKLRGLSVLFQLQEQKDEIVKMNGTLIVQENLERFITSDRVRVEIRSIVDSLLLGDNRGDFVIFRWSSK